MPIQGNMGPVMRKPDPQKTHLRSPVPQRDEKGCDDSRLADDPGRPPGIYPDKAPGGRREAQLPAATTATDRAAVGPDCARDCGRPTATGTLCGFGGAT